MDEYLHQTDSAPALAACKAAPLVGAGADRREARSVNEPWKGATAEGGKAQQILNRY